MKDSSTREFKIRGRGRNRSMFGEAECGELITESVDVEEWHLSQVMKKNRKIFLLNKRRTGEEGQGDSRRSRPDVDLRMMNQILRSEPSEVSGVGAVRGGTGVGSLAVTGETLLNEFNRELIHAQLRRKLGTPAPPALKSAAARLIRSFNCLANFRHLNLGRLEEFSDAPRRPVSPPERMASLAEFASLGEQLEQKFSEVSAEVRKLKDRLAAARDGSVRQNQRLAERVRLHEAKVEALAEAKAKLSTAKDLPPPAGQKALNALNEQKIEVFAEREKLERDRLLSQAENQKHFIASQQLEHEIRSLKFNRHLFRVKLREFHLEFLKREELLVELNVPVTSVLLRLWTLKQRVDDSAFSSFFDPEDIKFAKEFSLLLSRLEELKKDLVKSPARPPTSLALATEEALRESEISRIAEIKEVFRAIKNRKKASLSCISPNTPCQNSNPLKVRPQKSNFVKSNTLKINTQKSFAPNSHAPKLLAQNFLAQNSLDPNILLRDSLDPNSPSTFSLNPSKLEMSHHAAKIRALKESQIERILRKGREITKFSGSSVSSAFVKKSVTVFFGAAEAEQLFSLLLKGSKVSQVMHELNKIYEV